MSQILSVGLGEAVVSRDPQVVLVAYGLGSCLGVAMYDPVARVAGLLHAVLPTHQNGYQGGGEGSVFKYVDSGIYTLLTAMEEVGAQRSRLIIKLAGGANMLVSTAFSHIFEIGTRNVQSAYQVLESLHLRVAAAEVGGNAGRTIRLYVSNGRLTVRKIGDVEIDL
jgi:chemotaxis protein CheD